MGNIRERYIFNKDEFTQYRKNLGLTRHDLADRININERTIKAWETGEGVPSTTTIISVAENLKIRPKVIAINMNECIQAINKEKGDARELVKMIIKELKESKNAKTFADEVIADFKAQLEKIDDKDIQLLVKNPKYDNYNTLMVSVVLEVLLETI